MNPPSRMPARPSDAHIAVLKDRAERENLKRIIDTDMEAWGHYNDRVHGIHRRLYLLDVRKKWESIL